MKVLIIVDTLQTGGAEKSILEITSNLKKFTPIICSLFSDKTDLKSSFYENDIKVLELNLNRHSKFWFLQGKKELEKLIKSINPDIIHAHLFKSELITRIANIPKRIPVIGAFVNDSYSSERYNEQSIVRNLKLNFIRFIDFKTAKKIKYFTSITNAIAHSNARALKIDVNKIATIYRGRSIHNYNYSQPVLSNNTPFIFLTVARLLNRKGYFELIDAIEYLKNNSDGLKFVCKVAGDGADRDAIISYANKKKVNNYVQFLGNQKDVVELLANSHCFIFPSHYEGQGGALVEAMLSAKPVILSDIPVFKEQVTDNKTGIFFELKNHLDLANKMKWVIENIRSAQLMGLEARKYAISNFDIVNIAGQYDDYYENVLVNHNK